MQIKNDIAANISNVATTIYNQIWLLSLGFKIKLRGPFRICKSLSFEEKKTVN